MKLKQRLLNTNPSPEGGYTIIESLVAMIMVAALMVAVAPVIVFSVGTRVQARRIELGAQAARSYIDWVRADIVNRSPNVVALDLKDVVGPDSSGGLACNDGEYCTTPAPSSTPGTGSNYLYCVDGNGDGACTTDQPADMVVQGIRNQANYNGVLGEDENKKLGYSLGVRVYRADAFTEDSLCPGGTDCPAEGTQQSSVTNAIGNKRLPIAETTTEISPTESMFKNLRDRLDNN